MPWHTVEPLLKAEAGPLAGDWTKAASNDAKAILTAVRKTGLSIITGAMLPGVQALGAPVFNTQNQLEAAIYGAGHDRQL